MRVLEVLPGRGVDGLCFGSSMAVAEETYGPAPEREYRTAEYWRLYYPELGLDLFFDEEYGFRLSSIELNAEHGSLLGVRLSDLRREHLTDLLGRPVVDEGGTACCRSMQIDFHFSSAGSLESLSWGPFFDDRDSVVWPKSGVGDVAPMA